MSEEDRFEDLMSKDHGGFESLEHEFRPVTTINRDGSGITIRYGCPRCQFKTGVEISWAEVFCIAAGFAPQDCGLAPTIYQADAADATGFGPAVPCPGPACGYQHAPFVIFFTEAKKLLDANPIYKRNPIVIKVEPVVRTLWMRRQAAAQAAQAGHRLDARVGQARIRSVDALFALEKGRGARVVHSAIPRFHAGLRSA